MGTETDANKGTDKPGKPEDWRGASRQDATNKEDREEAFRMNMGRQEKQSAISAISSRAQIGDSRKHQEKRRGGDCSSAVKAYI